MGVIINGIPRDSCLVKLQEGEPFFVLRAQDRLAASIVQQWAKEAKENGVPDAKVQEAREVAEAMRAWPTQKTPD